MVLARPIPLPYEPYRYLLQRDREITADMIPRLKELGVVEVWIRHRDLEFLEDVIDVTLGERQRTVYLHVRRNFESIMRDSSAGIDLDHFQSAISELFVFLKGSTAGSILLQKLDAFDNYLMSHSANVCYLSLLLGMRLEQYLIEQRQFKTAREAKDLHLLGLGCLLHDIGKMRVPPSILYKPGALTAQEMDEMRRHTTYGYQMLLHGVPSAAAQIALNHHQRWNGTGYPARVGRQKGEELPPLCGSQIHIFSRIALVADVYDAATSKRCYSEAKLPVHVLHEMRTQCQGLFDPVVESAFCQIVPPFPIGQVVTLSDGVEAAVVDFNPGHPVRPKVRCLRTPDGKPFARPALEEIDLAACPDLEIASVDGQDVRPFTSSQQGRELVPELV